MQRRCHPDTGGIQGLARCHPDVGGTQGQASISNRGLTQTLEGYKAWPAYPAEMPSRHWRNTRPGQNIQQKCHPDCGGTRVLASIFSRGVTQTLGEYKAWPAYPAEASPRHCRNTKPAQHIHQMCHPDTGRIQGLASISSRGVTQTLEECRAWPAYPAEVPPRQAWPASSSAKASPRQCRM